MPHHKPIIGSIELGFNEQGFLNRIPLEKSSGI